MKIPGILSFLRTHWRLSVLLLIISGWWLTKADEPIRFENYTGVPYLVSNDGHLFVTRDGQVGELPNGEVLRQMSEFGQSALSTNGQYIAVNNIERASEAPLQNGRRQPTIDILRTTDQSPARSVQLQTFEFNSLAIDPNGTYLAVGSQYDTLDALTIYDTRTGQRIALAQPSTDAINQLYFAADNQSLMMLSRDFHIIDTQSWQIVYTNLSLRGRFTVSEAAQLVAFANLDEVGLMAFSDLKGTARPARPVPLPYPLNDGIAISPDGKYIAVIESVPAGTGMWNIFGSSAPQPVRMALVQISDGRVVQRFEGPNGRMNTPVFTPDGTEIMTLGPGKGLGFWRVAPREAWEFWLRMLPVGLAVLLGIDHIVNKFRHTSR